MSMSTRIARLLGRTTDAATARDDKKPKGTPMSRFIREWVAPIMMVVAVMMPIRSSIADWNDVPSGSMRPTILEGDRICVNKLAYGLRIPFTTAWISHWSSPSRGEIITFASPLDGIRLVKRVVGVPGDRISMLGNTLMINGEAAEYQITDDHAVALLAGRHVPVVHKAEAVGGVEHAIAITPGMRSSAATFGEIVVPAGQYFVLGDNRDMSNDSRFIGFVPLDSIYGRSGYVALSVDPENSYLPRWDRFLSALK